MSAGLIPTFHRCLGKSGRWRELSSGWRQAFVLLVLLLFVFAAIFPANSRGILASETSVPVPTPCELLFCDGSPRKANDAGESPADEVRYVDGVGFVVPGPAGQRGSSPELSEHF